MPTWTLASDEVNLLRYAAMKQFLSSSGIKSLNGSQAADLKSNVNNNQTKTFCMMLTSRITAEKII
jgi:hypothetical protein